MYYYICNEFINKYEELCRKSPVTNTTDASYNEEYIQNSFKMLEDKTYLVRHCYKDTSIESCLQAIDNSLYEFWCKYKDGSSNNTINKLLAYIYTWYKFSKDIINLLYCLYHDTNDAMFPAMCKNVYTSIRSGKIPPLTDTEKQFISVFGKRMNDHNELLMQLQTL